MKNDFFDLPRFWHFSKKTMIENWINIAEITFAAIALMLICFHSKSFEFSGVQFTSIAFLALSSSILTSILLNKFSNKSKSIDYLLFPASSFEKIMVVLMIVFVFHICLFLIFHQLFVHLYFDVYLEEFKKHKLHNMPEKESLLDAGFKSLFKVIIFYQSFITMGSLFFKRNSYFKSLITLIIVCFFIFCINWLITHFLFRNANFSSIPFIQISISRAEVEDTFRIENKDLGLLNILHSYVLPICFLMISYFKLKEKEV